jgi:hypothetical protein
VQYECMPKQLSIVHNFCEGRALYRVFSFMRSFVSIKQHLENVFFPSYAQFYIWGSRGNRIQDISCRESLLSDHSNTLL